MASPNSRNGSHDQSSLAPRFAHTDVLSAYSTGCSPSTPDAYIRALARQYPINAASDNQPRPAIAIADYGLHSAVKTAMAGDREGVDHLVALRVRVVAQRAKRTFFFGFHPNGCRCGRAKAAGIFRISRLINDLLRLSVEALSPGGQRVRIRKADRVCARQEFELFIADSARCC